MRPPAIERMGYYPTDDPVVEIIRTYLKPPAEKGRLFVNFPPKNGQQVKEIIIKTEEVHG